MIEESCIITDRLRDGTEFSVDEALRRAVSKEPSCGVTDAMGTKIWDDLYLSICNIVRVSVRNDFARAAKKSRFKLKGFNKRWRKTI